MDEKELSKIIAEELDLARERIYRRLLKRKGCRELEGNLERLSQKYEWSFITLD